MFISRKICQVFCLIVSHIRLQKIYMGRDPSKLLLWWDASPERRILVLGFWRLYEFVSSVEFGFCCYARGTGCIWGQENAIEKWELLFSLGITENRSYCLHWPHTISVSSCHLQQPNKMRKISPLLLNHDNLRLSENSKLIVFHC